MASQLVHCPHLSDKLDFMFREFARRPYLKPCITSNGALAAQVGVSEATVSIWRNGSNPKNRDRYKVTPKQLGQLAALLALLLELVVDLADAKDRVLDEPKKLLTESGRDEFDAHLKAIGKNQLLSVLRTKPETIGIQIAVVPPGLGASPERLRPKEGEVTLHWGDNFVLKITGARGRGLVVIARDGDGWGWLVPGPTHNGNVTAEPELVPSPVNPWGYDEGKGPGFFVAITVPKRLKIPERGRETPVALTQVQEQLLVKILMDKTYEQDCAWGQKAFFIDPLPA